MLQPLHLGETTIRARIASQAVQIEYFTSTVAFNTEDNCIPFILDEIPRDGRQLTVDTLKSLLICIKPNDIPTVRRLIKLIEDTVKQTDLDRTIDVIITACNIPPYFLGNANGLIADAVRPILKKAGLDIERLLSDYPNIAIALATLTAKHDCQPTEESLFHLAKFIDTSNWKSLQSYTGRQAFKHLFKLVVKKQFQRENLLQSLVQKDLKAKDFIGAVLKQGEELAQQLLKALEALSVTVSKVADGYVAQELGLNGWVDALDSQGETRLALLIAVEGERDSLTRSLFQAFSTIASLLLALNEFTRDHILACIKSDNPPAQYKANPEGFQKEVDDALRKYNQFLTGGLLEAVESGHFKPWTSLGSYAAHILSTYKDICELCKGACQQQGPREFVREDYLHHNIFIHLKDLIREQTLDPSDEKLQKFIDDNIPLEKLISGQDKGDPAYLDHYCEFGEELFYHRQLLLERDHSSEQSQSRNGLTKLEDHRIDDPAHYIGALHILASILHLRTIAGVKKRVDIEKWLWRKVSQIIENISGTAITGPTSGKHQTDFIETIRKDLIKSITALWDLKREEPHTHRLDNERNKLKLQKILEICKRSVTVLSTQLAIATSLPLKHYHPSLTVLALVIHGFFNQLLAENRGLVIADEAFIRDGELAAEDNQAEVAQLKDYDRNISRVVIAQIAKLPLDPEAAVVQGHWQLEVPDAPPVPSEVPEPQVLIAEGGDDPLEEESPRTPTTSPRSPRRFVNPVTEADVSRLQVSQANTRTLETNWSGYLSGYLQTALASERPTLVTCNSLIPVEAAVERRPLSPTSYEDGMPPAQRARSGGSDFRSIQDQPRGYATENSVYGEEARPEATAVDEPVAVGTVACDHAAGQDLRDSELSHIIDEYFGSDEGDSSDSSDSSSTSEEDDLISNE